MFRIVMKCLLRWSGYEEVVEIPQGVRAIGADAFTTSTATRIRVIRIPESVEEIQEGAFRNCSALEEIRLESGNSHFRLIGPGLYRPEDRTLLRAVGVEEICTMPDEVLRLGRGAFSCSPKLTRAVLPHVKEIGADCFHRCTALEEVVMPEVCTLEEGAFEDCENLTLVRIPPTVSLVYGSAFCGCGNLRCVIVDNPHAQLLGSFSWWMQGEERYIPLYLPGRPGDAIPDELRLSALLGLGDRRAAGETVPKETLEPCMELIRKNIRSLWRNDGVFQLMLEEQIIGTEDFSWLLEQTVRERAPEKTAALLEYRNRFLSTEALARQEMLDIEKELKAAGRSIRGASRPPSRTQELRRIWSTVKLQDGTQAIRGVKVPMEHLEVPTVIGRGAVSMVREGTGKSMAGIRSVTVPPGIALGSSVFSRCDDLEEVTLPLNLVMGSGCFTGCPNLRTFHLDPAETVLSARGPVLYEMRSGHLTVRIASGVTGHFAVPEGVEILQDMAFLRSGLSGVTLPSTLVEIGAGTFLCCEALKEVTIPPGVRYVGYGAFEGCRSLETITILSADTKVSLGALGSTSAVLVAPPENESVQELTAAVRNPFRPLER